MWNNWKLSKLLAIAVLLACSSCGFAAQGDDEPIYVTISTSPQPPKPTISTTTTTTTTTTTKVPPTTSTTTTTTTKVPPTTSTTTTTTPKPTPTTPAPPPKPFPDPSVGKWNTTCIMIQMATQLNLTYETKDKKTSSALLNVPPNATVQYDSCGNQSQQISLQWGPEDAISALTMYFKKNDTKKDFSLTQVVLHIPIEGPSYPNAKDNQTVQLLFAGKIFSTPLHMSYHCTRKQHFNLTETFNNATEPNGSISLSKVQFEAFRENNKTGFSTAKDCDAIDTPDIVPIAVGIALATLIVIVLIAYLIARRRSTARGYTSF